MQYLNGQNLLPFALRLDAVISAAFGALAILGGPLLADVLGTPLGLIWPVGVVVLVYAAGLWLAQRQARVSPAAGWTVIGLNVAWAVASVATIVFGWFPLTGQGVAFVLVQAIVVAGLADLQFVGVRRIAA